MPVCPRNVATDLNQMEGRPAEPTANLSRSAQRDQALPYVVCVSVDGLDLSKEIASSR